LGVKNFARGEEQYFEELYTLSSSVDILIQLKKGLFGQGLRLKQANTTLESHQKLEYIDKEGRAFHIYADINTSRAGNRVVLYCKNALLVHTLTSLDFFYDKKPGVFNDDNSHEFPDPVKDYRVQANKTTLRSSTNINLDENPDNEPTIFIHKDWQRMCASLSTNRKVKSSLVAIGNPGL
jgi:hypothetical protein